MIVKYLSPLSLALSGFRLSHSFTKALSRSQLLIRLIERSAKSYDTVELCKIFPGIVPMCNTRLTLKESVLTERIK